MDASKLTNGSRDEVLAKRSAPARKSGQPNAVRSEAEKVSKRATGKKAKIERPPVKAIRSSKTEKLLCRYCGPPASSSGAIADVANVSASAMDRRQRPGRRKSKSRFAQGDDRGWARTKLGP
jgi:hypothetical protein